MANLLTQLREEASRLADEAAPEVVAAIEHIGTPDAFGKILVALVGRLEESVPTLLHPIDAPLPSPLTTVTPSDAEIAEAEAVKPNPVQVPVSVSPPVQVPQAQQPTVEQLQAELAAERAKVTALQSAATPTPTAPQVSTETQA